MQGWVLEWSKELGGFLQGWVLEWSKELCPRLWKGTHTFEFIKVGRIFVHILYVHTRYVIPTFKKLFQNNNGGNQESNNKWAPDF